MSLYIDHHLDVLASSPAEIQQIAERLDRPSAELGNCNPIWSPEQVAELFHWETVAKLDYGDDALNKARRFHISGTRTYGIVIDHVGEVSEAFPAAIFLLAYSDEMGGAAKFVFHAGAWMPELEEWNQHSPYPMEWALLDIFAPFRNEYASGLPFGSLWKPWLEAVMAAVKHLQEQTPAEFFSPEPTANVAIG